MQYRTLQRLPAVLEQTGDGRTGHYDKVAQGLIPPPVQIGPRAKRYPSNEIEAIVNARISGATDAEIRKLVLDLVAARKNGGVP